MSQIKFTNFAHTTLAAGITDTDVTISVAGGQGNRFPVIGTLEYFYATLENAALQREIVKVTARSADTFTVVRGQDNTTAASWNAGDTLALRLNAAAIEDALSEVATGTVSIKRFSGDGVTTAFMLDDAPAVSQNVDVFIGGVYQNHDTFTVSGVTVTFTEAPTEGTNNIETRVYLPVGVGSTNASLVTYTPAGTGAVATNVQSKLREFVSVLNFGADPTGAVNATAAFNSALTFCKANSKGLRIPDGTYLLTADGVNFAGVNLAIYGEGKPTLQFTGTGKAFVMDTLLSNGSVFGGMRVENLLIVGGPSVTDGFYSRGIARSVFSNIEVRECSEKAFHILHGVSNQYDTLKFSTNSGPQTTTPVNGFYLTNNGAGYYTADCAFNNAIAEGFAGTACYLNDASGNTFHGGTFEGMVGTGLQINPECRRNAFRNVWFEVNTVRDAIIDGVGNSFDNCYFGSASSSPTVDIPGGTGTQFIGGFVRQCNLQVVGSNTSFVGVTFSDNVSLGITGAGATTASFTTIGCTSADTNLDITVREVDNFGTVNGLTLNQGITFPATQVASTNANTLDDYEEGTWTAAFVPTGSGSITLNASFQTGSYVKIGKLVTVTGIFLVSSVSSPVGALTITGLPFLNGGANSHRAAAAIWASGLAAGATTSIVGRILTSESRIFIEKYAAGSSAALAGDVIASSEIYLSMTYIANA
jgi:hypothetical protein